ncbi:Cleavage and polyadenylation specificity factor subunit 3 [Saguinus oedipus]|uniref:Cleavage and polyadenylation specificity factor subunit 3 n=1 Tax=Saguinus oedipus TaxID=9490 RepID=A0ABQ9U978_SAGOE|nr:Cleavage and polyadenylation specificity factor subunit 3 [Saguinus oedipus]
MVLSSNYTDLAMSTVKQTQAIPYTGPFNLLYYQLQKLTGDVEELEIQEKPALKVFKNITVIQEPGMVVLEWLANPSNDMYADTVTTVILEVQSNPKIRKAVMLRNERSCAVTDNLHVARVSFAQEGIHDLS